MSNIDINSNWLKEVARLAYYAGISAGANGCMVMVSANRYDNLEEWVGKRKYPVYASNRFKPDATVLLYGVVFAMDSTLEDDEVLIRERV
jgi:hypothetical protein